MSENKELIIIPDIHGRDFWKQAVKDGGERHVVFLGDYLDPYGFEGITEQEAWNNFMEIVDFKKANPSRVHLLLGNHDLGYMDMRINDCRRDRINAGRNQRFFLDNLDLFDLAHETILNGKRLLLSHAGVNRIWHALHFGINTPIEACLYNSMLHGSKRSRLMETLADVSYLRGGPSSFGSMVWADIREFTEDGSETPGIVQIVGHTLIDDGPVMVGDGEVFCLDCRKAFMLTEDGRIEER